MARKFPPLGEDLVKQIETAWGEPQPERACQRLRVVRLIAQHELTAAQIMRVADVSRQTVFTDRDKVGARVPAVRGAVATEFIQRLAAGQFRQARAAQVWIKKRSRQSLSESGVRKVLRRLGGKLKVPRKSHAKKDQAKTDAFKVELPARLTAVVGPAPTQPVRLWVLDEHRYGLLPVIRRVWARRGGRVHAPSATKYQWGDLHEALEVDGENRVELLFTPAIDQDIHPLFLRQIGAADPQALHGVIADQAGCHLPPADPRLPANVRLLPLPPYSPELNPVERFGGLVRGDCPAHQG